jgi:hypothetical protein
MGALVRVRGVWVEVFHTEAAPECDAVNHGGRRIGVSWLSVWFFILSQLTPLDTAQEL